jgi:hypothetical protein
MSKRLIMVVFICFAYKKSAIAALPLYMGCLKKTTLKEYTNVYRAHTQRFELS